MDVILYDNVKSLGRQGEIVKVSEGYFRNFLKPKNLAQEATPAALKRWESMKKKEVQLAAEKVAEARELAKRLEDVTISVKGKAGDSEKLFGSITTQEIADAMKAQGYTVDKKNINLEEPIKKLGIFTIGVRIHPEVEGKVKLLVERI
jgi:large subunit ribosomal protein L9